MLKIFDLLARWGEKEFEANREYYASLVSMHGAEIQDQAENRQQSQDC